jgi:hypothetical protein
MGTDKGKDKAFKIDERFVHHPWFLVTRDLAEAKQRFASEVRYARPAFQQFYDGCLRAYGSGFEAQLSALDVFEAMPDKSNINDEHRNALRGVSDAIVFHSTVAERNAGALLQQSAELIEALLYEVTGSIKPIHAGLNRFGVHLDDALKACGNYTRHKAEWLLKGRLIKELSKDQECSLSTIAQLLSKKRLPPLQHHEILYIVFSEQEPMRACLFSICEIDPNLRQTYDYFENALTECGTEILERYLEEGG